MRVRDVVKVVLGLLCATLVFFAILPRVKNNYSCASSIPTNAAQKAALADARSRTAKVCSGKFEVDQEPNGPIRISLDFVKSDLVEGCILEDEGSEVAVYDRGGAFVRIEDSPYGLE